MYFFCFCCCSVTSCISLWPQGLQHRRHHPPSLSPRVCSESCSLSQWYYLIILSSVTPFYFCFQSFPSSGSFSMSWYIPSGGQSIGVSAIVLAMNIQGWFPLELTVLISLQFTGLSRVFSSTTVQKYQFLSSAVIMVQLSHLYTATGKTTT